MWGSSPDAVSASPVSYTATIAGWFRAAAFWSLAAGQVEARVTGQVRVAQDLHRDVAVQTRVAGLVNLDIPPKPRISPSS